jgi:hypothetical protein
LVNTEVTSLLTTLVVFILLLSFLL